MPVLIEDEEEGPLVDLLGATRADRSYEDRQTIWLIIPPDVPFTFSRPTPPNVALNSINSSLPSPPPVQHSQQVVLGEKGREKGLLRGRESEHYSHWEWGRLWVGGGG